MTSIQLQATIPESLAGQRLDQALSRLFPEYSRSLLQTWIKSGQVTVNQHIFRPRDKVQAGQSILINATLTEETRWVPQAIPLDILHEDEALFIINKPAGLIVHPGAGNPDKTLVNALLYHDPQLNTLPRAGIIHRLDKDTSGLLVVARTLKAHHALTQAMQAREIKREYETIVQGVLVSGGDIDAPVGRHPTLRTQMAVVGSGRPAITHYRILERFTAHTWLRIQLETGRTHQIRVHFQHLNYPIIGDQTYTKRLRAQSHLSPALQEALNALKRQALHATQLELLHPISGKVMRWQSPLPADLQSVLDALQDDIKYNARS